MAAKAPQGWYDISVPLKQGMISLPIDPVPPKIYRFSDVDLGAKVTMSMLEIISHTGTHIDTPRHFIPGGSTVSDMPLDSTVGPARVIEIKDPETIKAAELKKHNIKKGERLLFKTRNSPASYESPKFVEDYVYLDGDAAEFGPTLGRFPALRWHIGEDDSAEEQRQPHDVSRADEDDGGQITRIGVEQDERERPLDDVDHFQHGNQDSAKERR